jgi:hypothetical protein
MVNTEGPAGSAQTAPALVYGGPYSRVGVEDLAKSIIQIYLRDSTL